MRCFKCQEYGHHKNQCSKTEKCAVCSGRHNTGDCIQKHKEGRTRNARCPNCKQSHHAWNPNCPARLARMQHRPRPRYHGARSHNQPHTRQEDAPLPTVNVWRSPDTVNSPPLGLPAFVPMPLPLPQRKARERHSGQPAKVNKEAQTIVSLNTNTIVTLTPTTITPSNSLGQQTVQTPPLRRQAARLLAHNNDGITGDRKGTQELSLCQYEDANDYSSQAMNQTSHEERTPPRPASSAPTTHDLAQLMQALALKLHNHIQRHYRHDQDSRLVQLVLMHIDTMSALTPELAWELEDTPALPQLTALPTLQLSQGTPPTRHEVTC